MNDKVSVFLEQLLCQIRNKKIRQNISLEICSHIEEHKDCFMADGMKEEEAYEQAVNQMGEPESIGKELNRVHRMHNPWGIFLLLGVLAAGGIFVQFFYEKMFGWQGDGHSIKQTIFFVVGSICFIGCYLMNYKKLYSFSLTGFIAGNLILAGLVFFFGTSVQGATYIRIGDVSFQPALLFLLINLIFYSGIVKRYFDGSLKGYLCTFLPALFPLFCILGIPSMVFGMMLAAGFYVILISWVCSPEFKGNRKTTLTIFACITIAIVLLGLLFLLTQTHVLNRLVAFLRFDTDPHGMGWLHVQIRNLLSGASWIGDSGLLTTVIDGKAVPTIPNLSIEFVLHFIIGRLGWLAGAGFIALLGIILIRLFSLTLQTADPYGKVLGLSICTVFSLQVVCNVLMCLNWFPSMGIPLPFLSFGGSSYLVNMALLGLLLGVYRRKDIVLLEEVSG